MPLAWEMTAPPPGPSDRSTTAIEYPGLVLGSHHGVTESGARGCPAPCPGPCWWAVDRHKGKVVESEALTTMRANIWRSMGKLQREVPSMSVDDRRKMVFTVVLTHH